MDFDNEIKVEFLLEARELLEHAEESFLEFERDPGELVVIDNIFRLFHTLKGSGLMAGFEQFGKFTHSVENLLTALKNGSIEANDEICEVLISSNDILNDWVRDLEDNHDYIKPEEYISGILDAIDSMALDTPEPAPAAPTGELFGFFDEEEPSTTQTDTTPAPASEPATPTIASEEQPSNVVAFQPKSNVARVLIVDDEPDIREIIEMFLEDLNLDVSTASDGTQALEMIGTLRPDIILSDLRMPNMDGINFISKIREQDKDTQVIFISGAADRDDIISFIRLGAYGFIEKPISRELLINLLSNALYAKRMSENVNVISELNFKMHMLCYQLLRTRDEAKQTKLHGQIKQMLDEIAEINNQMNEMKGASLAK